MLSGLIVKASVHYDISEAHTLVCQFNRLACVYILPIFWFHPSLYQLNFALGCIYMDKIDNVCAKYMYSKH